VSAEPPRLIPCALIATHVPGEWRCTPQAKFRPRVLAVSTDGDYRKGDVLRLVLHGAALLSVHGSFGSHVPQDVADREYDLTDLGSDPGPWALYLPDAVAFQWAARPVSVFFSDRVHPRSVMLLGEVEP